MADLFHPSESSYHADVVNTLAASMTATVLTCTVLNPERIPTSPVYALIDTEVVQIYRLTPSALTMTVVRAQENTLAATHAAGAAVTILTTREEAARLSLGGSRPGDLFEVNALLLAGSISGPVFIAHTPCVLVAVKESHTVVGGAAAAVDVKYTSGTTNIAGATTQLGAAIDCTATVNTVVTPALIAAPNTLAAGDRLNLVFSGTLTGLVGGITLLMKRV